MFLHTVPPAGNGMKLAAYLPRAYPLIRARDILKKRDVRVNGARQGGDHVLKTGDELAIYAVSDFFIPVAGISGGLMAVIKPQGLPVDVDSDGIGADTALTRVHLMYPEARLCHRLDAPTGGVLIFALDDAAYNAATKAFRERTVEKSYTAIVSGSFDKKEGTYKDYLVKDAARATVKIIKDRRPGALTAETRWRVMGDMGNGLYRVDLDPVTGRTHQLRAHMSFHGHPILGDDKYGDRALNRENRTRLCLWCASVSLCGAEFSAEAPNWLDKR